MSVCCSICSESITQEDFDEKRVADLKVFKFGELDSILLAHAQCALDDRNSHKWTVAVKDGYKWVKNIMSGRWIQIAEDTPRCCDPSTELYWSM